MPSQSGVVALSAGEEIELYVIASNDGWEWVRATVLSTEPLRIRWWDGDEKSWDRPGARLPEIRRVRSHRETQLAAERELSQNILALENELAAKYALRRGMIRSYEPGQETGWCVGCGQNVVACWDGEDTCGACLP